MTVEKFDQYCNHLFVKGTTPNLPGILVGGTVQNQNRYKLICQKYKKIYRFATLYDTTNRIPVFSAYTFTGDGGKRPENKSWMIEPQLENITIKEMKTQEELKVHNNNIDIIINHQAADADYYKQYRKNNKKFLDRGHLFPCSYAPDNDTKMSTFTLTNIVPQYHTFNGGSWEKMELNVRESLEENCTNNNKIKAYVVTGAVPNKKNNKLKERVNIPDILWTALCCYNNKKNKWMAGAHWGENVPNGKTFKLKTLGELEDKLKNSYKVDGFQVFPKKCKEPLF
ncbi:endonuclease domain-containing 1 protein-like [Salvelinus fontinalis]|uniref:endonuclease domain-containing 1 protein-like n=1 Tax=Salvelinus fontinalis TaxID=8038 RepID=UPI0024850959|nr:endonuclease domain-containing 1 protein-like [Salvelinus fontinalis]